jgi:hypothetical protein
VVFFVIDSVAVITGIYLFTTKKQVILLYLCFRQILPDSDVKPEGDFDELLGNGKTVILYLHGTTGTRY